VNRLKLVFDKKLLSFIFLILLLDLAMMTFGPRDSLDKKLYYTGAQARVFFAGLDGEQLRKYFVNELFDFMLIFSYTGALLIGLRRVYSNHLVATALALAPGLCDLIETSGIMYSLVQSGPHEFFEWLGVFTFLKWTLGGIATLAFLWKLWTGQRTVGRLRQVQAPLDRDPHIG
jgi:hypothetical protein